LVVGPPSDFDPAKGWRGTVKEGAPAVRVLHVGDCAFRSMEMAHDFRAPVGYPAVAAERLGRQGIGLGFNHYFAVLYEYLPDREHLLRHSKVEHAPDVVLIHLGGTYHRKLSLGTGKRMQQLRSDLGKRLGRAVFAYYRGIQPVVRVFGRYQAPYHGTADLERFIEMARAEWPDAQILIAQPYRSIFRHPRQQRIAQRVHDDIEALSARSDVHTIDFNGLIGVDPSLRGANGFNLNSRGSQIVGAAFADWLLEHAAQREKSFQAA
jgi:GDSL-like lipase/acylhydrolase family protein